MLPTDKTEKSPRSQNSLPKMPPGSTHFEAWPLGCYAKLGVTLEVRIYDLTFIRERRFSLSTFFSKAKPNFRGEVAQPPFGVNSFSGPFF